MSRDNVAYPPPIRVSFNDHELRLSWLSTLMDVYYIIDKGISKSIKHEEQQGKKLACDRGCASCCKSHDAIPVYPLELMGMSWYATEVMEGELRETLKAQLRNTKELQSCPFLIENNCSLHTVRPMACRSLNVFNKQCLEEEDAYSTRREDVLTPIKEYTDEAFDVMLPFYGIEDKDERKKMIENGGMHQMAKVMRELNWSSLADKMDDFEEPL